MSCNLRPEPLRGTGSCFYRKDEHLQVGHMWDSDFKASFADMNPGSSHYSKGCFEGGQIMKGRLHGHGEGKLETFRCNSWTVPLGRYRKVTSPIR